MPPGRHPAAKYLLRSPGPPAPAPRPRNWRDPARRGGGLGGFWFLGEVQRGLPQHLYPSSCLFCGLLQACRKPSRAILRYLEASWRPSWSIGGPLGAILGEAGPSDTSTLRSMSVCPSSSSHSCSHSSPTFRSAPDAPLPPPPQSTADERNGWFPHLGRYKRRWIHSQKFGSI